MMSFFSVEEDEKIIDFVKNHECIYNVKSKDYRNSQHKKRLWCELGWMLNKTDVECIKRWNYIRDYYVRRRGKPGTGSSGDLAKKRSDQLSFLDGIPSLKRSSITNVEGEITEATDQNDASDAAGSSQGSGQLADDEELNFSQQQLLSSHPQQTLMETPAPQKRKRKASNADERLELLKQIAEKNSKETLDETDHFFMSVAKTVKQLPKIDQAKLRMAISNLVGNAELAVLTRNVPEETPTYTNL